MLQGKDLLEARESLKQLLFDKFVEYYPEKEDEYQDWDEIPIDSNRFPFFEDDWESEIQEMQEIDEIERQLSHYGGGVQLHNAGSFFTKKEFDSTCRDIVEELVEIPASLYDCIDWDKLVGKFRPDYIKVEYQGESLYYII